MSTELDKMLRGEPYNANEENLLKMRTDVRVLVQKYNNFPADGDLEERKKIFKEIVPDQGENCYIEPPCNYDYGCNIHMGDNVYFNFNSIILDVCPVYIGSNTLFGPRASLYTATHPLDSEERKLYEYAKPIHVGSDCFIGGNSTICPGVTIGDRVVIGAGSVVCKDIPSDCVAAGNPCKVIRYLTKPEEKKE